MLVDRNVRRDQGGVKDLSSGIKINGVSTMQLSLFAVQMICEPLVSQSVTASAEMHRHFASLDLVDCSHGESITDVNVLIGSDYYWNLVTGDVHHGSSGPTAIHTRLGFCLVQCKRQSETNSQSIFSQLTW